MAPLARRSLSVAALVVAGLGISACGQSGLSGAKAACDHVEKGLRSYDAAADLSLSDTRRRELRSTTRREFMIATHLAARASVQNGHWTAFATSLSEVHRVGIDSVVPTLRMQCETIRSGTYYF